MNLLKRILAILPRNVALSLLLFDDATNSVMKAYTALKRSLGMGLLRPMNRPGERIVPQ